MKDQKAPRLVQLVFWIVAAFYAYGALVHILNMLSLTGFDWLGAPLKWRVLDVIYLVLDLIVAIGLIWGARLSIAAFFCAAFSQIVLYTVFRDWILEAPEAFRRSSEEIAYLDLLVGFHIVTCLAMATVSYVKFRDPSKDTTRPR